jgi:hypothetical protein
VGEHAVDGIRGVRPKAEVYDFHGQSPLRWNSNAMIERSCGAMCVCRCRGVPPRASRCPPTGRVQWEEQEGCLCEQWRE